MLKVKVQVYSLMSSLKTYQPTLHLNPPRRAYSNFGALNIVHIAISFLPGTHFHLSQVKHLRVKCPAQVHNIETMSQDWEGNNMIFLWNSCTSVLWDQPIYEKCEGSPIQMINSPIKTGLWIPTLYKSLVKQCRINLLRNRLSAHRIFGAQLYEFQ